jgi:hypothetical protein
MGVKGSGFGLRRAVSDSAGYPCGIDMKMLFSSKEKLVLVAKM